MVQAFPISGFLNMDDPDEVINPAHNKDVLNVVFRGTVPNLRGENVPGTTPLTNSFITNDGTNLTIGRYYDPIGKRIFFWNFRNDGNNAIYVYNTIAGTFQRLVENGINAEANTLNFTANGIIFNIDIIYGDSAQGDILCFIDSVGHPKKLNIQRALSGGYGTIKASYMDIAKEPADIPPKVVYEDDATVTVNNLRKKLFKLKIRWAFDDQDKAVTSSQGELSLPYSAFDTATDTDPTKNCRLAIVYQTGPENVKKIEILGAVSLGTVFSDFFLIASLDKAALSIPDNDIATYLFYNDKAYNYIDVQESIQDFDRVPITAGAQALLNGNVLDYANTTEGYPNLTDFSASSISSTFIQYYQGTYFELFTAAQDGMSGFGSGNIHIVVRGTIFTSITTLDTYTVYLTDATAITYTLSLGDDASDIINGLRSDAISKGYTIISTGTNDLYVFKTGKSLARTQIGSNYLYNDLNTSLTAYDWWSKHGWALVYFDEKGRTNGAVYSQDNFSASSPGYSETIGIANKAKFQAVILHRPPLWAKYYQWVRTKDTTKSKFIQWISDRTNKDTTSGLGNALYAYISIENLNTFINKNAGTPLGYTYSPNDRIRFIKLFNSDGTTNQIYANKDYEIVASETNPTINGVTYTGQFIKILLPATSGTFDFGGTGFANYFVELYTPAQSVANGLDVYYEYGERYAIGNPGTNTAFHQGMLQNQSTNLATPATFEFIKGDDYVRRRSIQTGQEYIYTITPGFGSDSDAGRITLGCTFTSASYIDPNILNGNSPYNNLIGFNLATDNSRFILKSISGTYTFRIKGTIIINFRDGRPGDSYEFFLQKNDGTKYQLVDPFDSSQPGTHVFQIDTTFTLNTNERIFIFGWSIPGFDSTRSFTQTTLTITRDSVFNQVCIDPNFSDFYPSAVNSNGRAFVFDPDANQVNFPVLHRWSLAYQQDTNVNQINRFYAQNFDEVDRSKGAIKRMGVWDRLLTFFQERKCGQTGIYQKFITDSGNNQQLITTNDIITENNVQYYAGDFGCGNQPDGIIQSGFVYYFPDPIKGKWLRLSRDGLTDLSELYKVQTFAGQNLPNYLSNYDYQFGGIARLTGTFNIRKDNTGECLFVLQAGTSGINTISGITIGFDESRNSFNSKYSFSPECILCAENVLYSWVNGIMYVHNNTNEYNNFYGQQYDSYITRVFNAGLIEKKSWISITEVSNSVWDCPEIYTNQFSYGTTPQQSNLITQDFVPLESTWNASFLGDINSIGGIGDGDVLKGNLIVIKFRSQAPTSLVTLSALNLYYIDSPLTAR